MLFDSRTMYTSKDQGFPEEYEDAFQLDGNRGVAAVADGVSSAIFSRQWADLLTRGVIGSPPNLYGESEFRDWLAALRQEWLSTIDVHNLPWNQRLKLQQVGGAYSTLLWVELYSNNEKQQSDEGRQEDQEQDPAEFRFRCFSIGDCSLFHIRGNEVLRTFPLSTAAEFDADPVSICSVDQNRDHHLEFMSLEDFCRTGDLLVLCTDAIGKWAVARMEANEPPDWSAYWDMPHETWLEEIVGLRADRAMRYDDTTLVMLKVGGGRDVAADGQDCETSEDGIAQATNLRAAEVECESPESKGFETEIFDTSLPSSPLADDSGDSSMALDTDGGASDLEPGSSSGTAPHEDDVDVTAYRVQASVGEVPDDFRDETGSAGVAEGALCREKRAVVEGEPSSVKEPEELP